MVEAQTLMRRLLLSDDKIHPVLDALGGAKWFHGIDKAGMTAKEVQRYQRVCRNCGIMEIQKTLSRCGGCRAAYYW